MKTLAALLLISAFAAFASANEAEFHKAVIDFLDERHDEHMKQLLRDQGFPEDTHELVASDKPKPPLWAVSRYKLTDFIFDLSSLLLMTSSFPQSRLVI